MRYQIYSLGCLYFLVASCSINANFSGGTAESRIKLKPGVSDAEAAVASASTTPDGIIRNQEYPGDTSEKTGTKSVTSPCSLSAAGSVGAKTSITLASQLRVLERGHSYVLANDIVLDGGFEPIPEVKEVILDGAEYSILGLSYSNDKATQVGLFQQFSCGIVKNLRLNDVQLSGGYIVGSFAAILHKSRVIDLTVTGGRVQSSCTAGPSAWSCVAGGIIGATTYTDLESQISGSSSSAEVSAALNPSNAFNCIGVSGVGGLVGVASGLKIVNSSSSANVKTATLPGVSNFSCAGGLVGAMDQMASVDLSFASGNISDGGGLVGTMDRGSIVDRSYATGTVNGTGLVGMMDRESHVRRSYSKAKITSQLPSGYLTLVYTTSRGSSVENSYAVGIPRIQGLGLSGFSSYGCLNCYEVAEDGYGKIWRTRSYSTLSASGMKEAASYEGFENSGEWTLTNGERPVLKWQAANNN